MHLSEYFVISLSGLLMIIICSCTPVNISRLPERDALGSQDLQKLENNYSRIYMCLGYSYERNGDGIKPYKLRGVDANVFINDRFVDYINEYCIVVDLIPGEYSFEWSFNDLPGKELHKSEPLVLNILSNDTKYMIANSRDITVLDEQSLFSVPNLLSVLGGPVGGAIAGAAAEKDGIRFVDQFEIVEETSEFLRDLKVASYHTLADK